MCCRARWEGWVLTVGVEAVDAELDFGEDATGGVQLAIVGSRLYHLRSVEGEMRQVGL